MRSKQLSVGDGLGIFGFFVDQCKLSENRKVLHVPGGLFSLDRDVFLAEWRGEAVYGPLQYENFI